MQPNSPQGYGPQTPQYQPPQGPPYAAQGYLQQPPPPPKKTNWALVILLGFVGISVFGIGSCLLCVGLAARGAKEAAEQTTGGTVTAGAAGQAAVATDLATLLHDYKGNEVAADNSYKGRRISVTGVVRDVKKDVLDHPYVTLGTGGPFEIPVVQCTLAKSEANLAAGLSKGQTSTLTGTVSGLMMNVQLKDCRIE